MWVECACLQDGLSSDCAHMLLLLWPVGICTTVLWLLCFGIGLCGNVCVLACLCVAVGMMEIVPQPVYANVESLFHTCSNWFSFWTWLSLCVLAHTSFWHFEHAALGAINCSIEPSKKERWFFCMLYYTHVHLGLINIFKYYYTVRNINGWLVYLMYGKWLIL